MANPVIEIEDLWFSFDGPPVLMEVYLEIPAGDFLALIGPNGGGKTTLIKLMLGLLHSARGKVRLFGKPSRTASHRIGYVPQDLYINRSFPISAMDVALMGTLSAGWRRKGYTRADRNAAKEALDRMDVGALWNDRIGELSGGQIQRVLIARALVNEPQILFLDEPTAHLDSQGQSDLYALLRDLNRTITIVMVSHDLSMLSSYVKSVACVNRKVHYHNEAEITHDMIDMYQCPIELIAHGIPHRVLKEH